ncbi:MAG: hypothetical protein POELPBGB_02391 [Bacteroidia bacterium]|nr:hypothetical protein [Bacteroidia bacterium]
MQKIELKPHYDIVVIGAGMGGLTAAALLSKTGFSVCVLEMADHPGGYLAGFRRKDFRFDTAIHWLNQCGPQGLVSKVFDILGTDYPRPVAQKRIRRVHGHGFDYTLTNNPDEWKNELIAKFPNDKDGIERFFKAAKRIGKSFDNFSNVFRSEESMTFFESMRFKLKLLNFALPFIPYIRYSGEKGMKKGLSKFFKDPKLQEIFCSESELLSCLVPIGWAYYGDYQSPPKGGSQVFPEWLEYVINYFGNEIYYRSKVNKILVEGNKAVGVNFECRGKEYTVNSKYVLAASDIETLYEKMLPESIIPEKMKKKLRQAKLYSSSVTVSIALDCPAEDLGFNEEMIYISLEGNRGEHGGGDPEKCGISILAPSQRDKSMAPEGKGTLTLYIEAAMDYMNNWRTEKDEKGNFIRGEEYVNLKNEVAEKLIKRVESKLGIELKKHILFYEVATPVTHYRYTGNKNGTMMGARPGRENMQAKVAHYQTPVENLILSGHWAELGGGVPIAVRSGANAALLVLRKENKAAFKLLAKYMDNDIGLDEIRKSGVFKAYDNSWKQKLTPAEKLKQRANSEEIKNDN